MEGEIAEAAEEIIRETCKELDISGQKGYEKAVTVSVIDEEKEKAQSWLQRYMVSLGEEYGNW